MQIEKMQGFLQLYVHRKVIGIELSYDQVMKFYQT